MKTYEAMLLLDNREVKKGWDSLKEKVDGVFKKHGAEIIVAKRWDERKLAYEIKKQRRATYYLAYIKASPDSLAKLNFDFKLAEPVLRHLLLKVDEVPAEAFEPEKEFQVEASTEEETGASEKTEKPEEELTSEGESLAVDVVAEVVSASEVEVIEESVEGSTEASLEAEDEGSSPLSEGETKND